MHRGHGLIGPDYLTSQSCICIMHVGDGGNAEGPQRSSVDDPVVQDGTRGSASYCQTFFKATPDPRQILQERGESLYPLAHTQ